MNLVSHTCTYMILILNWQINFIRTSASIPCLFVKLIMGAESDKHHTMRRHFLIYCAPISGHIDTPFPFIMTMKSVVMKEWVKWIFNKQQGALLKCLPYFFRSFFKLFDKAIRQVHVHDYFFAIESRNAIAFSGVSKETYLPFFLSLSDWRSILLR